MVWDNGHVSSQVFCFVFFFSFPKPSCVLDFLKALNQIVNALELTCIVKTLSFSTGVFTTFRVGTELLLTERNAFSLSL